MLSLYKAVAVSARLDSLGPSLFLQSAKAHLLSGVSNHSCIIPNRKE